MDIELETVQYKFASIIGELCGKPTVLSRFAVWLDLRLAEYKLKGSISLDCSGQKPDPDWLQGLKDDILSRHADVLEVGSSLRQSALNKRGTTAKNRSSAIVDLDELGDDSDIVIKDETPDGSLSEIYPVRLHLHEKSLNRNRDNHNFSQKRRQQGTFAETAPSNKSRRATSTATRSGSEDFSGEEIVPFNQSLMSVINQDSGGLADDVTDNDRVGMSSQILNSSNNVPDSNQLVESGDSTNSLSEIAHSSIDMGLRETFPVTSDLASHNVLDSTTRIQIMNTQARGSVCSSEDFSEGKQSLYVVTDTENDWIGQRSSPHQYHVIPTKLSRHLDNKGRRNRIKDFDNLPAKTVRNIVAALGNFERWLWSKPLNDQRNIEEIPPTDLDVYLAEYFATIKKPSGDDYTRQSFQSLRSGLERYLKDYDYPCSITSSPMFQQSQLAFNTRKTSLNAMAAAPYHGF